MKWLNRLAALMFGLVSVGIIRELTSRYKIFIFDKEELFQDDETDAEEEMKDITELKPDYSKSMDLRGAPTHVCACGCNIFNVKVIFFQNEIATYFLDMECANCGSLATAPTPVDHIEGLEN